MRIAYVCADPGVPIYGWQKGCSIHVQEMVRALRFLGHEIEIFAANPGGEAPADLISVQVHRLPCPPRDWNRSRREQHAIFGNRALGKQLQIAGPFDLIYERYSLWSFAGMRCARHLGVPGVLEVNAPLIDEQDRYRGLHDRRSAEQVAARCFRDASTVAAVSSGVADYVRSYDNINRNVVILPNGVDVSRFANRCGDSPQPGHRFTVGFVGSLKPWHGVDILIDAFDRFYRKYSRSRLLIVGDGPEHENILRDLRSRGLEDAATLTGAVKPSEIPALLARMDVAAAPYPASEGFYFSPLKLYEYMAAGLPVVASDIGQVSETVTDEVHGLLCPPGDPAAIADALLCLLNDSALRRRMGLASRKKVLQQHTWTHIAQRVVAMTGADSGEYDSCRQVSGHGAT